MKYFVGLVCSWLIAGSLFSVNPAGGDFSPLVLNGGSPSPAGPHKTISMESEVVAIRLKPSSYTVDASFCFINTGATTTELIGFPKTGYGDYPGPDDISSFHAWADGRMLPLLQPDAFAKQRGNSPAHPAYPFSFSDSKWIVTRATFSGQGKTTLRARYEASYRRAGGNSIARYTIGTGRFWKGKIGKAVFIIDCSRVGGAKQALAEIPTNPGARLLGDNVVTYTMVNFEPAPHEELTIWSHCGKRIRH